MSVKLLPTQVKQATIQYINHIIPDYITQATEVIPYQSITSPLTQPSQDPRPARLNQVDPTRDSARLDSP